MIDNIIQFSIKNKAVILLFTVALIIWGSYSLTRLPLDAVPDITNNQVQLITVSPNLAAQEVEKFITYPIELAMQNLPGVVEIRSVSRFGLSVVTVVFEDQMGTYLPRQLVSEQLKEAEESIPEGFGTPDMAPISTGLGEIYQYEIRPAEGYDTVYNIMELRTMQDWIVKRQLSGTEGVIEVNSFGGYLKQYEVAINPEKLRSLNLTIEDVYVALDENNANTGGAYIEKGTEAYFIRGEGLVESLEDIRKIFIKNVEGIPIYVKDVAEVGFGHAARFGAMTRNGEGEIVGGIVMMLKGANTAEVIENVKEKVEQIKESLPEGVIIEPFIDRSKLIDRTINTVAKNLIEGGLIVIFILVLLMGSWRAGLVVASVIPLSMLFAFAMMHLFGVSANLMSLGAIDFGLIVDGAVIIVESIVHRLGKFGNARLTQGQMDEQVLHSSVKIRKSAAFGEIIILIVYLPILALVGIEGKMFGPMAKTVSFAILGALLLSLTYVPMASALFLSKKIKTKVTFADKIMAFFQRIYNPVIHFALRRKALVIITTIILFVGSLLIFSRMGGEFIPQLDEGDLAINATVKSGSSLSQTIKVISDLEAILMEKFPEVEEVVSRIGAAEIPTDPMPIETGDLIVVLKDKDEWTTTDSKEELVALIEEEFAVIPGVNFEFSQPIELRFNELMTGVRSDIAIKIYGEDLDVLFQKATQADALIAGIEGVGDTKVEQTVGLPQMSVKYNRDKLAQYGVSVAQLNNIIQTGFAGKKAGVVFDGEKQFDLVVRLQEDFRQEIENLRNMYVSLPNGAQVPMNALADISFVEGPQQISRDNTNRRIVIGVNTRGRDVESLVNEIQPLLEQRLDLPAGYYITYGGQFENLVTAKKRLSIAVPIALALIFILLFFTFGSFKHALLIFTAIPLSAIGGILALYIRGMPFSISAGVGFIALFGVAVLNGIVLIGYFNQLKEEGMVNINKRILIGTRVRLRPVIMTAAVASLGFLPMALSQSAGAEVQRPLATVVIGGLVTATLLTLVVLPVLYSLFSTGIRLKARKSITGPMLLGTLALALAPATSKAQDIPQDTTSLEQAIEIALENNPQAQAAELAVKQQEKLQKSAFDIGKTDVYYGREEYDPGVQEGVQSLGIRQNFNFPTVYLNRSKLQKERVELSGQNQAVTKNSIIKNVSSAYYQLAYGYNQLEFYTYLDSLYQRFYEAADLRYQTGETNYLEKVTAQGKQQEIILLKQQALTNIKVYEQELRQWMNVSPDVPLKVESAGKIALAPLNAADILQNPVATYLKQNVSVAASQYQLQKANLLPDIFGQLAQQQVNGQKGFYLYQFGISVPLWFRPQQGRIQAAKIETEIRENEYENQLLVLETELQKLLEQYRQYLQMLTYYENQGLLIAGEILKNSTLNYRAGEIGYVEYLLNINQIIEIRTNYYQTLNRYNQTVVEIEYLTGVNR